MKNLCIILFVLLLGSPPISLAEDEPPETLFLRDESILSSSGNFSSEIGVFFRRLTGSSAGNLVRRESSFASLTMRYGMTPRSEFSLSVPYLYVQDNVSNQNIPVSENTSQGWGDVVASFKYQVWFDSASTPDLIVSMSADSDSGDVDDGIDPALGSGHWEYSLSALVATTYDPAIYFARIGYRIVDSEIYAGQRSSPGDAMLYQFGSGFALSSRVIISFQLVGEAVREGRYGNTKIAESHKISFQFANTILLSRNRFVEPLVSFGLTPEAPDILFGVSFPLNL